ncbi:MAG: EAL domain-containing protein [Gemmatimonadetes bacterium]|nr:EAL domain-containing protein [Gemmatimonadota bacterium]MBI3568682.1 EAL domain-containing protein [Gemmatimonadota bacterium]
MSDSFIARQPIFDRENRLAGYELLYRAAATAVAAGNFDAVKMSSQTLVTGLLTIGLDQLTGGVQAFINFPRELLLERDYKLLDPTKVTIEILETVECDDDTVAAAREARSHGYRIALDDFAAGEEYEPFLRLAHVVKVDVLGATPEHLRALVTRLRRYDVTLLAERIEDAAMLAQCRALGFTLFQGYYFSRPEIVKRRDLPAGMIGVAKVMNLIPDPKATDRDLEGAFRSDPGLSFKLLRIVNSAGMGGSGIESIQQAIRIVGRAPLHRWLALLFVNCVPMNTGIDREMVLSALERGRLCELLAINTGRKQSAPSLFLAGVLSTFDAILGMPMTELLRQVKVSADVESALLKEEGPYTPYLMTASAYARGDWEQVITLAAEMDVLDALPGWYTEASSWAREILSHA